MKIILVGASGTIGSKSCPVAYKESVEGKRNGEILNVMDFA